MNEASSSRQSSSSSSSYTTLSPPPHPYYPLSHHHPHHPNGPPSNPLEPAILPTLAASLREPPNPDLLPRNRPTLSQFRSNEGASTRAAKLRGLWNALPALPNIEDADTPTDTQRMKLPGQDTLTALSPERAERLRRLYEEELVKRCNERRPEARLWGGADDLQPEIKNVMGKGVAWEDFRWVARAGVFDADHDCSFAS